MIKEVIIKQLFKKQGINIILILETILPVTVYVLLEIVQNKFKAELIIVCFWTTHRNGVWFINESVFLNEWFSDSLICFSTWIN